MIPTFSVIIPTTAANHLLTRCLAALKSQTYSSFEVITIDNHRFRTNNPAEKRNRAAALAHGHYLVFLDDDSYPNPEYLNNSLSLLKPSTIAAVCGPCLTPPDNSILQKASGLVWSSYLGSGGAGTYRCSVSHQRFVDDFPSVNLIVKKNDFFKIGGFNTTHWPGEDTVLCHNLVYLLGKKILYHPSLVVYHHRRPIFIPHLKQIKRYAIHRGYFIKIYPKTSFRLGYFLPTFLVLYLITLLFFHPLAYFLPLNLYIILLLMSFMSFLFSGVSLPLSFLAIISISATHLVYGVFFIVGLLAKSLSFVPRN